MQCATSRSWPFSLGPEPLLDAAQHVGITLARGNTAAHVREALPQVGYGQAEVLATPLRMARVAAAIAADGVVPEVRWDASATSAEPHVLVTRESARLLGRYMRDVVVDGTGRTLRGHPVPDCRQDGHRGDGRRLVALVVHRLCAVRDGHAESRRGRDHRECGLWRHRAAPAAGEIIGAAAALGLAR